MGYVGTGMSLLGGRALEKDIGAGLAVDLRNSIHYHSIGSLVEVYRV
jgi:hypothetical protein